MVSEWVAMCPFIGGDARVWSEGAKGVHCNGELRQDFVPEVHWKIGVCGSEGAQNVIFGISDSSLGFITAMVVGRYKLDSYVVCFEVRIKVGTDLVVHALECDRMTEGEDSVICFSVCR